MFYFRAGASTPSGTLTLLVGGTLIPRRRSLYSSNDEWVLLKANPLQIRMVWEGRRGGGGGGGVGGGGAKLMETTVQQHRYNLRNAKDHEYNVVVA